MAATESSTRKVGETMKVVLPKFNVPQINVRGFMREVSDTMGEHDEIMMMATVIELVGSSVALMMYCTDDMPFLPAWLRVHMAIAILVAGCIGITVAAALVFLVFKRLGRWMDSDS